MKKTIFYTAMVLVTLAMSSCGDDFLDITPKGTVSENTLSNNTGINYLLTGAYATLNGMGGWNGTDIWGNGSLSNFVLGDMTSGDASQGADAMGNADWAQLESYQLASSNSAFEAKWNSVYEAVKRCNMVLKLAEDNKEQLENYNEIIGQALFIRGLWMFDGIKAFGAAIPFVTLEDYRANNDPQVSNVDENGNYIYVWDKVAQDLKDAADLLPETWPSDQKGRVNSWAAKALLSKLYIYWSSPYNGTNATQDHWADAKILLKDIIDKGVDSRGVKFRLADKYGDLYDASTSDWTGESIIDVQLTISGTQTDTNCINSIIMIGLPGASGLMGWGFYQPTYELGNSYITDENGLPASNYQSLTSLSRMENGNLISDLDTPTDPRIDFTMGRFGVPYLDYGTPTQPFMGLWVRDYASSSLYMNKKVQPKIADRGTLSVSDMSTSSAKNFHILRLAEVYLMYAECAIHDGDLNTAREYINKVRARAANDFVAADATTMGSYTLEDKVNGITIPGTAANYRIGLYQSFANATEAHTALEREYRAEFGMEGHRWFDLARWGNIATVLNAFTAFESKYVDKFKVYDSRWVTYPIPLNQIQTGDGRFVQNENWK